MAIMKIGKIAKEGYRFFVFFGIIAILIQLINFYFNSRIILWITGSVSFIFAFLSFFSLLFFRNPKRVIPESENIIVSPADGKIVQITEVEDDYTGEKSNLISVFMNVFNVHINRNPISGEVQDVKYKEGKFLNAAYDAASIENEQNMVLIEGVIKIKVIQIAGLIARRIKCFIKKGEPVKKGDYLGLIQFGSRLDITVPKNVKISVKVGDKVKAGSSQLGEVII